MSRFLKFDRNYPTGGVIPVILFISISDTIEKDLTPLGGSDKKSSYHEKCSRSQMCMFAANPDSIPSKTLPQFSKNRFSRVVTPDLPA